MDSHRQIRVLAISGSLRRASSNTSLIEAATRLAPGTIALSTFDRLAGLPPFNPDHDDDNAPPSVLAFRSAIDACDAILISSPEYAHGVPGVLKNALDWLVGSCELVDKPVAVVNASSRATHAWASLVDTLTVMSARVIDEASVIIPLDGRKLDASGIVADAGLAALLTSSVEALAKAARAAGAD